MAWMQLPCFEMAGPVAGPAVFRALDFCSRLRDHAFLIMRLIQIRNTAPIMATMIVPMTPPA